MKTTLVLLALSLSLFYTIPFTEKDQVFERINAVRQDPSIYYVLRKDKSPAVGKLIRDTTLEKVAQKHADILAAKDVLFHVEHIYAECCAMIDGDACPVASWIVDSDTPSLGHRKAIMSDYYDKIGIGIAQSKSGRKYYVIEMK